MKNALGNFKSKMKSVAVSIRFSAVISWQASKLYFLLRIILQIVTALLPATLVLVSKALIDLLVEATREESKERFTKLILLLSLTVGIKLFQTVISKLMELLTGIHQDLIGNHINLKTMEQTNRLDLSYFDSPKFHDEFLNARNDSHALSVLAWSTINLISFSVQMIAAAVILAKLHWIFMLLLIVLSIPSIIIERRFTQRIYNWSRKRAPEERRMGYIMSIVTDRYYAKEVRLYGLFGSMLSRYMELWSKWFREKKRWSFQKAAFIVFCSLLPEFGIMVITIFVCLRIMDSTLTIGDFGLYTAMAAQMVASVWGMISVITGIYENDLKINNYRKFLSWKSVLLPGGSLKPSMHPRIEFINVCFRYPNTERYILKHINFTIMPKEKVALVGVNGAGKTTIIKLLLRFYDVTEGQILIDGINVRDYDTKELRKAYGVMFQDLTNYAFTVRENITISDIDNTDSEEQLLEACHISGVDKLTKKWNSGLDTYLTKQFDDMGEELSGGEWQKIALARAFYHRAGIIVLDEPTAALDAEAEYKLFSQYTQLFHDSGAILISHRLSSMTLADRILVLEDGSIIENGPHPELMKNNGRYAYLFTLQAERYQVSRSESTYTEYPA
ncbi:MAG: transporter ATP-binding protein [Herbinix sp.]|jgi:ABC-type multidrug transport system fused ATPase/permease subunit|nr:transporter ATP-binding protein [Herbinix sp.]